jgi:sigma-B regulation protein RsbQ
MTAHATRPTGPLGVARLTREAAVRRHAVSVRGDGPRTLLFAHGFGCSQAMWRHVAPAFEHDHRVVCFDHLGSGCSDLSAYDSRRHARLHGYAQDVLALCEALDLHDVCFVGHSVSAMIGLLAAIAQPERFERLVLIAPSPCYLNSPGYEGGFERADLMSLLDLMERNHLGWAHLLAATVMQNPERPELAEELRTSFCSADPRATRQFARATFLSDHRADVPRLTRPALVMQCAGDLVAPLSVGDYLQRHLRAGTLVRLKATGHCPQLSEPAETIQVLSRYLAAPHVGL